MKNTLTGNCCNGMGSVNGPIKLDTTVTQPRKNVGFFVSTRLAFGVPLNKALPNRGSRSRVLLIAPSASFFHGEEKAANTNPLSEETRQ